MPDGPLRLTENEFAAAVALVHDVGFATERTAEEAWPHFRGWRVNYEDLAYRWAERVLAPPAPWSGTSHAPARTERDATASAPPVTRQSQGLPATRLQPGVRRSSSKVITGSGSPRNHL